MSPTRLVRALFILFFVVLFASTSHAQTTANSTQGPALLQKALAALAPSAPITEVTLSGTARRIAGSADETGTVVLKALAGTGTRLDLTLPSGPRCEIRNTSSPETTGSWSGTDGVSHAAAYHNLLTDPGWFPALAITALLSAPHAAITYLGMETRDGQSVIHIKASEPPPASPIAPKDVAELMQHLTEVDVFLDAATLLPASFAFSMHADNNALLDIAVEIHFSTYRVVNGAQIPFHVQKFINNTLFLDLQFDSAAVNSGLSAATFEVN